MTHLPVNHHLRPVYRFLAAICGLFILIFGVTGAIGTGGKAPFGQTAPDTAWVFGLRANFAFAVLSIIAGVVVLGANAIGGNLARVVNLAGGVAFLVAGMAMLSLMQSDANFLAYTMTDCVVSFIIGLILLGAGLYGKVRRSGVGVPEGAQHPQPS